MTESIRDQFQQLVDQILLLEKSINSLPDYADKLDSEQKVILFKEFKRLNENISSLTDWISFPISQRSKFEVSSSMKVLMHHEKDTFTFRILETSKK